VKLTKTPQLPGANSAKVYSSTNKFSGIHTKFWCKCPASLLFVLKLFKVSLIDCFSVGSCHLSIKRGFGIKNSFVFEAKKIRKKDNFCVCFVFRNFKAFQKKKNIEKRKPYDGSFHEIDNSLKMSNTKKNRNCN